jgi:hypothetical protein
VRVYEYGVRLDKTCLDAAHAQIRASRALYNNLVATMCEIYGAMQVFVLDKAGEGAQRLQAQIDALTLRFDAARAADSEAAMREIAQERRVLWRELAAMLKAVRAVHKDDLRAYFARIGNKSSCDTYQIRCKAVEAGLGWGTANAELDNALTAWKKSMQKGRAPRFAVGSDKLQDSLTLQFTTAGGVPAPQLLAGTHTEMGLVPPREGAGRRRYGELRFRLGVAAAKTDATGTWQYHRPLPPGSVHRPCAPGAQAHRHR